MLLIKTLILNNALLVSYLLYKYSYHMQAKRRTSGTNEAMFKIIMIGDSGTGKSCLLTRYTKDEFDSDYKVTIGTELSM